MLVVTGEPISIASCRWKSAAAPDHLPSARHVVLPRTGHIGIVTQPDRFCRVMDQFLSQGA